MAISGWYLRRPARVSFSLIGEVESLLRVTASDLVFIRVSPSRPLVRAALPFRAKTVPRKLPESSLVQPIVQDQTPRSLPSVRPCRTGFGDAESMLARCFLEVR